MLPIPPRRSPLAIIVAVLAASFSSKSKSRGCLANGLHAKSDCSVAILGSLVLLILSAERSAWVATIVTGSTAFAIVLPNYPRAHVWRWEREPTIICRVPEKSLPASESLIFTAHG
jgi:hypothetical protein